MDSFTLGVLLYVSVGILTATLTVKLCTWLGGEWLLVAIGTWMLERWRKVRAAFGG